MPSTTTDSDTTTNPEELKVRLAFARFKVQNGMIDQNIDQIEHSVQCHQSREAAFKEQQEALLLLRSELPPTPPQTFYGQQQHHHHHVRADEEAMAAQNLVLLSSPVLLPSLPDAMVQQAPDHVENSKPLVQPLRASPVVRKT
ncbi:hypothetical protein BX666DRAFT_1883979 [Dichotomocladium elegans]|nr:hypothetical protein BX666DRAFT_1883979 [Dichotomocladium elegans]